MGLFSRNISTLVGLTLEGIDVVDGEVFFIVLDESQPEGTMEYKIGPDFHFELPDSIVDIEGNLADLIDSPITAAEYDYLLMSYIIWTDIGCVRLSADGPDTSFEAC